MPYKDPEKHKEHCRRYRETHREQLREWDRQYRNTPERQAYQRERYLDVRNDPQKWTEKLAQDRIRSRKAREQKRRAIIEMLGGKCAICGFSDWRALQIDHVNGWGNRERKSAKSMDNYYAQIVECNGWGYQMLCANCNQIKRYENGEGFGERR